MALAVRLLLLRQQRLEQLLDGDGGDDEHRAFSPPLPTLGDDGPQLQRLPCRARRTPTRGSEYSYFQKRFCQRAPPRDKCGNVISIFLVIF